MEKIVIVQRSSDHQIRDLVPEVRRLREDEIVLEMSNCTKPHESIFAEEHATLSGTFDVDIVLVNVLRDKPHVVIEDVRSSPRHQHLCVTPANHSLRAA